MRVLHTGDWHLGQTLKSFARDHEHRAVLDQIVSIVAQSEIDVLLVAGDVFDSPHPSGASLQLFYETLVRLHAARPTMTMVITAGNHDAAGRLESPRALLTSVNAHVVGNVHRPNGKLDASRHLISIRNAAGKPGLDVLAVSHPTASCLPVLPRLDDEVGLPVARSVHALYHELYEAVRPNLTGAPLIVMGHLHAAGAIESEGAERRILVGGQHAVPTTVFPQAAAYVALGHLHKAQAVDRETVRYCGSLLPLSATEQPYKHSVTLIDFGATSPAIRELPLSRPVPYLRVPATGAIRLDQLAAHLKTLKLDTALPIDEHPYLQIRLSRDGLGVGFRAEAERIAEAFPVRVVDLPPPAGPEAAPTATTDAPFTRLAERSPDDLFHQAFALAHGRAPDPAHLAVFHRIVAEA